MIIIFIYKRTGSSSVLNKRKTVNEPMFDFNFYVRKMWMSLRERAQWKNDGRKLMSTLLSVQVHALFGVLYNIMYGRTAILSFRLFMG